MVKLISKKVGERIKKVNPDIDEYVELRLEDYYWACSFIPKTSYNTERLKSLARYIRIRQMDRQKRGKLNARMY